MRFSILHLMIITATLAVAVAVAAAVRRVDDEIVAAVLFSNVPVLLLLIFTTVVYCALRGGVFIMRRLRSAVKPPEGRSETERKSG